MLINFLYTHSEANLKKCDYLYYFSIPTFSCIPIQFVHVLNIKFNCITLNLLTIINNLTRKTANL